MTVEQLCRKTKTFDSNTDPMNLIGKTIEYYYNGENNIGIVTSADDDSFKVNGVWVPNGNLEEVIK